MFEVDSANSVGEVCKNELRLYPEIESMEGLTSTEAKRYWDNHFLFEKQDTGVSQIIESSDREFFEQKVEANQEETISEIENELKSATGIKDLITRHPEKAELWKSQIEAVEVLNNPEASPFEIRSSQARLGILKGQLLEAVAKDALADIGFDVETKQRVVEGESGGTRPDVIAKNNTSQTIEVLGNKIESGEVLSIECKCGGTTYLTSQLYNHIPNQLSGHEGKKVLLTTSDIYDTPTGLAKNVCDLYNAKLVVLDVSVADIEQAIKEVKDI